MNCAFCTEFAALPGRDQGTRIICEVSGWVLLPTVGCFTPGYCLFMPLDHIDAVADAPPAELARVGVAVENMRTVISSAFGTVLVAEHGPRGCELGAGCCSHAHLHLIPVPDVDEVTAAAHRLVHSLHTHAPPRNREVEMQKAKERSLKRFA